MKKILLIFVVLFICSIKIKAYDLIDSFSLGNKVLNMYIEEMDDSNFHNGAPFMILRSDGEIVYCINPFKYVNQEKYYYGYTSNNPLFNLSDEVINRINLIAHFGYGYNNHTDIKWYGITQFVIWKQLNFNDIYFTDSYYGNRIIQYEEEINELESLIDNYLVLPALNLDREFTINSVYKIEDLNGTLNNYKVLDSDIEAVIINNTLEFKTDKPGKYKITFVKTLDEYKQYILYNLDDAQSLIYPGSVKDITFTIEIEVHSGNIKIIKKDSEDIIRSEATLQGAVYGLYDNKDIITTIPTDENGVGVIENIPLGQYYIKEITPSTGYLIDQNVYDINITKNNKEIIIYSKEDVIKSNIIINKYYGNIDFIKEDGAIFNIYNKNNDLVKSLETIDGNASISLEYGTYYIKQIKGMMGYTLVEDFNFFANENREYIFNLYNLEIPKPIQYIKEEKEPKEELIKYEIEEELLSVSEFFYNNEILKKDNNYTSDNDLPLIVKVPNTFKNNLSVSLIIILFGISIVIYGIKKTII